MIKSRSGHGAPGIVANSTGGHLQRAVPAISQDEQGLKKLFTQFSFPGGIQSRRARHRIDQRSGNWVILWYTLMRAFDNPD